MTEPRPPLFFFIKFKKSSVAGMKNSEFLKNIPHKKWEKNVLRVKNFTDREKILEKYRDKWLAYWGDQNPNEFLTDSFYERQSAIQSLREHYT